MRRTKVLGALVGVACAGAIAVAGVANATPALFPPPGGGAAVPVVTCTSDPNMFNTGYDAATGGKLPDNATDAHWTVSDRFEPTAAVAPPPAGTAFFPANVGKLVSAWTDSPFGNAQWISRQSVASPDQGGSDGDWYYRYTFTLSPEVDPSAFALPLNFLADNSVAEIFVNGVAQSPKTTGLPQAPLGPDDPVGATGPYYADGFTSPDKAAQTTLNHDWRRGLNTLTVQVKSGVPLEGFDAVARPGPVCGTPQAPPPAPHSILCDCVFGLLGVNGRH